MASLVSEVYRFGNDSGKLSIGMTARWIERKSTMEKLGASGVAEGPFREGEHFPVLYRAVFLCAAKVTYVLGCLLISKPAHDTKDHSYPLA